jgi:transcriptional regulator with XRE-family HTH domain
MKQKQQPVTVVSNGSNERVDPAWVGLVKVKMKDLGWDQKRLATESGVSTAGVSRLLKGSATERTITLVANALGISDLGTEQLQAWLHVGAELRDVDLGRFLSAIAFFTDYVKACRIVQAHTATIAQAQATFAQMTSPEAISLRISMPEPEAAPATAAAAHATHAASPTDGHSDAGNGKKRR